MRKIVWGTSLAAACGAISILWSTGIGFWHPENHQVTHLGRNPVTQFVTQNTRPVQTSHVTTSAISTFTNAHVERPATKRPLATPVHKEYKIPKKSTIVSSQNVGTVQETVAVFGGSMTYGWLDPNNNSFVKRAFVTRSKDDHVTYKYLNYAIPGYTAQRFNRRFPGEYRHVLHSMKPRVVVLAWGLENDMNSPYRDSVQTYGMGMKQEISQALAAHAVVLLVTPPVTKELATVDHKRVGNYIHEFFRVGQSFHNPNVVNCDVYHQMSAYMKLHHQTYREYFGNSWHPNRAGHILAGRILAEDLANHFGAKPIAWRNASAARL